MLNYFTLYLALRTIPNRYFIVTARLFKLGNSPLPSAKSK